MLRKCKECGGDVSDKAKSCPKCGAPVPKSMRSQNIGCGVTVLVGGGLILLLWLIGHDVQQPRSHSYAAEEAELAALEKSAEKPREYHWEYESTIDPMTSKPEKIASLLSANEIELASPYGGPQHARLMLRKHPRFGRDVMFQIERGQLVCSAVADCEVDVRFDDGKPVAFRVGKSADYDSTIWFIQTYSNFVKSVRGAKTVRISPTVYEAGSLVFEFDVSNLKWE